MYEGSITDVIGITVGQVEVREARTGVTAVLCPCLLYTSRCV